MALKACTVSIKDWNGTLHSVEVTAETLYEAIAQALSLFNAEPWAGEVRSQLASATVTVRQPAVKHTVNLKDFDRWLDSANKSPAETLLKQRLKRLLSGRRDQ